MTTPDNRAFWVTGPGRCEIKPAVLAPDIDTEGPMVTVRSLYSGISRGTESLVFNNRVPPGEYHRMRAPWQEGSFPFPVKYGYANVGVVLEGPAELKGRQVFCLYPHQQHYRVPAGAVTVLPEQVPPSRAVLAANMETAINGLWDAQPAVGDRVAVVGLGVVGLLVAWLVRQIPGVELLAIDTNSTRQAVAEALGLPFSTQASAEGCDLVVHASGHSAGLESALAMAGQEARIVELSWYGDAAVSVPLGHAFHPNRLELKSSQVGQIPPARQPRWSYQRRLALALSLLRAPELDVLISGESRFDELPEIANRLFSPEANALCHRIIY
ncbi:MAG: Semialdehyde dehydrogenase, NAD binding domain [Marinobacter excellens HL-55]|uniref:Semialdehyde dehydrogenase, NAD binding domain n=1 Tax=Marinobacter excellens HL-55 TaxID=1305731 RepID=A0A0P7ZDU7_9GAMM|nr:MAG: Semialdehyde dehydrogenase, NAD binding domain [Marinobacter excellens HL-55]